MVINWISFGIVCVVLVWHVVRSIRLWRAARRFSVLSILLIVAMICLLIAAFNTELNWLKWVGGIFVILSILWVMNPLGNALKLCEDCLIIAGDTGDEDDASGIGNWEENQILQRVRDEREAEIAAGQKEWAERFVESAPVRELSLEVPIQVSVPADFPTDSDNTKLRFQPGLVKARFSDFEQKKEAYDEAFVGWRIDLVDHAGQAWRADFAVESEALFEMGFSNEGLRDAGEFTGWTEAPDWMRNVFLSSCVVAQHQTCLDWRECFTRDYSGKSYDFRTKYFGVVIDLAWSADRECFFVRGSNFCFNGLNGIPGQFIGSDDSSSREVWGDDYAEPVVFPVYPHELLPFLLYSPTQNSNYGDQIVNSEICFRKVNSGSGLSPSPSVETITV